MLNLYYPPDTSATAKMARTVVDALIPHHKVTVLCGRPSYDPTGRRAWRLYQSEAALFQMNKVTTPTHMIAGRAAKFILG